MSKRSNNSNNAKKARPHTTPAAHERSEDAKARGGGRESGAGYDDKARNAADRFDRDSARSAPGAHGHPGAGAAAGAGADRDRDRAGAARAAAGAGGRDEARGKNRDR